MSVSDDKYSFSWCNQLALLASSLQYRYVQYGLPSRLAHRFRLRLSPCEGLCFSFSLHRSPSESDDSDSEDSLEDDEDDDEEEEEADEDESD